MTAALLRPSRAAALVVLLFGTRSEQVPLSSSLTGRALSAYFDERSLGIFPRNRLCRGLLMLPKDHADYVRGRHRHALRTNLRKAGAAGIRCETISDASRVFDELTEIVNHRRIRLNAAEQTRMASWAAMLTGPEMTVMIARDRLGSPLAITGVVIDDAVGLICAAVASSHPARWALHDYLVRSLIARGVSYLLAAGGGPFGALGFDANVHHYQRLLGYELRHLKPRRSQRAAAGESACIVRDLTVVTGSRQRSPAPYHVDAERAA
jgi:hypothetical protein